jgi:hypothetical protein
MIYIGYWPKYKDGMARVVNKLTSALLSAASLKKCGQLWNDLNMFHSELRAVAQGHLASEYDLRAPSSAKTKGERIKAVKDKAEKLAKGFLFLRGENDSNVRGLVCLLAPTDVIDRGRHQISPIQDFRKSVSRLKIIP